MNKSLVNKSLLILLLLFVFVYIKQNSSASPKLSDKYQTDQDLLDKSEYIMEGIEVSKDNVINYSGVDFITFNLKITDQLKGDLLEENIKVLQTIVPNDSTFKLLERGKEYILFLDNYDGPVTENAYVISGIDLGKLELINETIV